MKRVRSLLVVSVTTVRGRVSGPLTVLGRLEVLAPVVAEGWDEEVQAPRLRARLPLVQVGGAPALASGARACSTRLSTASVPRFDDRVRTVLTFVLWKERIVTSCLVWDQAALRQVKGVGHEDEDPHRGHRGGRGRFRAPRDRFGGSRHALLSKWRLDHAACRCQLHRWHRDAQWKMAATFIISVGENVLRRHVWWTCVCGHRDSWGGSA